MTKAIGYIRVSTEKQKNEGFSLEAQERKIRAMADVQDLVLDRIISDDESGKNLDRPGMKQVLEMVENKQVDTVIIAKLDRLTRSVKDLSELMELFDKKGVALVSVNESLDTHSAAGRLVMNIMAAVSQWEREAIGERTRDALAVKKANGQRVGTVPYGWKMVDGVMIPFLPEGMVVEMIKLYHNRGHSDSMIAKMLNKDGERTRSGTPWRKEYVSNILKKKEPV